MNCNGDKKGNITAAFASDLVLEGMTAIPNLLLKYYPRLGITDSEMMLIIQLLHLQTATNQYFPSLDVMAMLMTGGKTKIKADLAALIEKGVLKISHFYCEETDEVIPLYSYEPLFEKISEIWACEKVKAYQQMKKNLKEQKQKSGTGRSKHNEPDFARICQSFEKEFGRLLSPMEIEQVNLWLTDNEGGTDLIMEALKRAVMMGKHNFKYIDSILLEWQKNNLRTISEVQAYEANFRERQITRSTRRKPDAVEKKKDKFRLLYLG